MGKRSQFERVPRDLYDTPWEPVVALSPFLSDVRTYAEPCCGNGNLIEHLTRLGHTCAMASDLNPPDRWFQTGEFAIRPAPGDALDLTEEDISSDEGIDTFSHFITNPPWPAARSGNGEPTMSLIRHLSSLRPTWLLLSADFAHNVYASEVLTYCIKIVSVGRVKWMPDTPHVGLDNAAWYKFDQNTPRLRWAETMFHGRGNGKPVYAPWIEALIG